MKRAAIEANPTSSRRGRPQDGHAREIAQICTILLLWGKRRAAAGEQENSDSRRQGAVRRQSRRSGGAALAVEQGRVSVSDASRVIDERTEVQLRALERVTRGGSRNLAGAAQGLPPGMDCGGGRGYRRCWADPMAGLANAGTMGLTSRRGHGGRCGGSGVRSGAVAGVGSVARGWPAALRTRLETSLRRP